MKVLNFGSMNLDYVYTVPHFVLPGETLAADSRCIKFGGKGLNQSIALARAGTRVCHAGCVGVGGEGLKQLLEDNGVDTSFLRQVKEMQGHTVIQVNPAGENCILLYGGSNRCQTGEQIEKTLDCFREGDWLLLQNEINLLPQIVDLAWKRGLRIVLNPSPCDDVLKEVDYSKVAWLLVNEIEAEQITGSGEPEEAWKSLHGRYPRTSLVVTLGSKGSVGFMLEGEETVKACQAASSVRAVDTTAAGDTFTGYFIAGLTEGKPLGACMAMASRAAGISVTRPGAADSIPRRNELEL